MAAQTGAGTVTVTAAPNGNSCIQVVTFNNYSGAVSRLAPGAYTFQVVHVQGGTSQTVFTQPVTVRSRTAVVRGLHPPSPLAPAGLLRQSR